MCYVDTNIEYIANSFLVFTKTDDIYKDIGEHVQARFDTSNYTWDRLLPAGKKSKINWINERWIRCQNHIKSCWIKNLIDDISEDKKPNAQKKKKEKENVNLKILKIQAT